jgi:hypothetical protein
MLNRALIVIVRVHISTKMENGNCTNKCKKSDLIINVRKRDVRRFKAGAELSGNVNIMNVEFNEEIGDNFEQLEIKLHLSSEACAETAE